MQKTGGFATPKLDLTEKLFFNKIQQPGKLPGCVSHHIAINQPIN
jgi:hypothetical protein